MLGLDIAAFGISVVSVGVAMSEKIARRHRLSATLNQVGVFDTRGSRDLLRLVVTSEYRPCTVDSFELVWPAWEAGRPGTYIAYQAYSVDSSIGLPPAPEVLAAAHSGDPTQMWRKQLADGDTASWVVETSTNDPAFADGYREVHALVRTRASRGFRRGTKVAGSNSTRVRPTLVP